MLIGIDASRAFVTARTGTENYAYHVITQMLQLPSAKKHAFVLFIRPNANVPRKLAGYSNVQIREVRWPLLWTQGGLAIESWRKFKVNTELKPLDVLWIPAHTLPILRNPRLRTVVTIHGLEYRYLPEYHNWLQRWYLPLSTYYAARHAGTIIAVSEATKRDLIAKVKGLPDKVRVILEGVVREQEAEKGAGRAEPKQVYQSYGITAKKYVLFVGTVQPRKNLGALIAGFTEFGRVYPEYKLVIAGNVGWGAEGDLRAPVSAGIPEKVVWTGRIDASALRVLYLGAALYAQSSWTEGFGLPVLEAMQAKVPVVVSDGGALPEVVGEAGLVVPLRPVSSYPTRLSRAMQRLVGEAELRRELIKRGQARTRELSWKKTAEATLKILTI